MKRQSFKWILLLFSVALFLIAPILLLIPRPAKQSDPWSNLPTRPIHTNHADLIKGEFADGSAVTRRCLECHEDAAVQIMKTSHWTWESEPVSIMGHPKPVILGKKNAINNFCIGITSNWPPCTACHAGYGWADNSFDFGNHENVDCLVCHDGSGQYVKGNAGYPAEGVDLVAAARSVKIATRDNCGGCHFRGGGGDAVKHGDLDGSLYFPSERIDVHMGKHNFICTDCHVTRNHDIKGRSISVSFHAQNQVYCTDCHDKNLHADERITAHVSTVACQTCHIPEAALKEATKMHWDWSAAGQDLPEDTHEYLKIKGRFVYAKNIQPEYFWYNGSATHYILGDKIDPDEPTMLNPPNGDINDRNARIFPFKVHTAKQIFDAQYNYLLVPKTYGKGGFWTEFDWNQAAKLGSADTGLPYSGHFGFVSTVMFWPITHMVATKEKALQCIDCHSDTQKSRMDWTALGYDGDPMFRGGRKTSKL
ncbi:MAG TPA: tetrathionate reductase family octaheme c-type cytochrome [bacterium]|nr:tetrathionate reductase family octaheme c-type cytochrome [bacterium]HPN44468.1 tetrathionate reductase family octaheme c-type cytochrome [bacterium]